MSCNLESLSLSLRNSDTTYTLHSFTSSTETLIRDRIPSTPPTFNLEIKGFRKASPVDHTAETSIEIFFFVVPLPLPVSSIFYSMADDSPCLRGGYNTQAPKQLLESQVGSINWDRLAGTCCKVKSSDVTSAAIEATENDREKWNNRVKKMLSPPWASLYEPVRPKAIEAFQIDGADISSATSSLQSCLKHFVDDGAGSSKWLIGTQSIFGWDQGLLLEELNCLVEGINNESEASRQEPITHLELQVSSPPPFFALHHKSPPHFRQFISPGIFQFLVPQLFLLFVVLVIWWIVLGTTKWILISFFSLIGAFLALAIFSDLPSTHDSIGMAWSMKQWVKTGLPAQMSRKQVQESLRDGDEGPIPRLKLMEDGWYRFVGMEESDWVEAHKERLRAAIRNRRNGSLIVEWPGGSE